MLKSIVNGAEHDIISIPMKGKNLAPTATYSNAQTDTKTYFRPWLQLRKSGTNVYYTSYTDISSAGTYSFAFTVADDIDEIRLIHNGSKRNLYPVDIFGSFAFGDYVLSAAFTGANPSEVGGLELENIMLNLGSTPLPYEPYGYQEGWEVRDNQDRLIWGREDELETTTGTLPFKGYDLPVKVKSLLGNSAQNGTPSPDSPIIPEMCGVLNENIAIIYSDSRTITNYYYYDVRLTNVIPAGTYTLSFSVDSKTGTPYSGSIGRGTTSAYVADVGYMTIGTDIPVTVTKTFTLTESDCVWARFLRSPSQSTFSYSVSKIRIEEGSTAYGWKIPIENHGENLFDIFAITDVVGLTRNEDVLTVTTGETITVSSGKKLRDIVGNIPTGTYCLNATSTGSRKYIYLSLVGETWSFGTSRTLTDENIETYLNSTVSFYASGKNDTATISNIMLNTGNTALPYSPYLNETIPVYLGEVPTIRRIKKLVFDGTENWFKNDAVSSENTTYFYTTKITSTLDNYGGLCTHFVYDSGSYYHDYDGFSILSGYGSIRIRISNNIATSVNDFKSYLTTQYQNGTPVTVWYALETPETGIVNEPLCKIGNNYADELTTIKVHGLSAPLYGIGNYKDILNLSTGVVTRKIKKYTFTGAENSLQLYTNSAGKIGFYFEITAMLSDSRTNGFCTHFVPIQSISLAERNNVCFGANNAIIYFVFSDAVATQYNITDLTSIKSYLQAQYAAGTPVTIWYVLATPETETVTVPTGMTGEIEGYLTQISTPTPEHQSIPKWNGKEETGGTYAVTVYNIPEIETTTGQNTLTVDTTIAPYNVIVDGHIKYTYWGKIREYVRSGLAQTKFPVGTILYDNNDESTGRAFQVVGYDKHFDPSLTARGYNHSMTLCQLKLSGPWQFDAIEAFLYTTVEMQPGTYKFKIPNYDTTYGGNKTYYFTSTANVPVDSQITLSWAYQQPPKTVTAYAGPNPQTNTTAITGFNALPLSEWIEGESPEAIDLGTIKLANNDPDSAYGKLNHIHRARYGSNNYYQSGLRQLLNTDLASNNWWHPTTIFDRPYANRTTNGYLRSLNEDFINVLATPEITHIANNIFEYPSLDGRTFTLNTEYKINTDKVFLLSHTEVGLSASPNIGTVLDYYSTHNTNNDRIKYRIDNGNAYYWWFRTPYPPSAYTFRRCDTSGALGNRVAVDSHGVAPAHIIQ